MAEYKNEKVFWEGYDAFFSGATIEDNPCTNPSDHHDWALGFEEAVLDEEDDFDEEDEDDDEFFDDFDDDDDIWEDDDV